MPFEPRAVPHRVTVFDESSKQTHVDGRIFIILVVRFKLNINRNVVPGVRLFSCIADDCGG